MNNDLKKFTFRFKRHHSDLNDISCSSSTPDKPTNIKKHHIY